MRKFQVQVETAEVVSRSWALNAVYGLDPLCLQEADPQNNQLYQMT